MECLTLACNTSASHIPGACVSNLKTYYPLLILLFQSIKSDMSSYTPTQVTH
jgi:hypothetical protein